MNLYKINQNKFRTFFGHSEDIIERDVTMLAQKPDCSSFLFLSASEIDDSNIELQDSVPTGYDFTYCQEWGLEVNQTKIDRVIAELG
tara:strand:- start:57 stop:317 length:261 start_codon:yes stop_codon:yes gene_type:complete